MNHDTATLQQLYAERDRLQKLAKVREDRSAEFFAKANAEMDKMIKVGHQLTDVQQAISAKVEGYVFAATAIKSESVKAALSE